MNHKTIISLFVTLFAFSYNTAFAERPAAFESANEEQMQPESIQDDSRPAAYEPATPAEPEVVETEQVQQQGDVLQMPTEAQAQPVHKLDFPRRGMTQDKVQNELGRPLEIVPAVGQPPISRWVYNDRVVYFEYSAVIHVVAK